MIEQMKCGAIILAGGMGTRFKKQKQFIDFEGKTLWKHVYDKALTLIDKSRIIVVGVDVPGGNTRSESVLQGIKELDTNTDKVVILEAARPLVTINQIEQLLKCQKPSVTFAMPLVNTVIKKDGTYFNRNDMLELLTPQSFDYHLLRQAYASGKFTDMTDETRIMFEFFGIKPTFIIGGENLVKLTYERDLPIIENMFKQMKEGDLI